MTGSLQQALNKRLCSPNRYPDGRFEGRGIVICAGGPRYFTCAWVLISVLRRVYQIDLPIQVWHLGQGEMSEEMGLLLEGMQVEVIDAEAVIARFPARIAGGWPLKPYAIQNSRFREVLYLDADTVPLVDPRSLFAWQLYRKDGMLMWPDIVDLKATNPIWRHLRLQPRDCTSIEAGILLVDKKRAWDVLDLSVLLNGHVEEIYYAVYGDKDTFLLSSLLLNRGPNLIPHRPFIFDLDLVQRGPDGEPVLQHRTGSKWNLTGPNRPLVMSELMPACEEALAELRDCWSGVVFNPPARSERARQEETRLLAVRNLYYEPQGSEGRSLELLQAGRVGKGRGEFEQHWAVVERDGMLVLQFYSTTRLTIELTQAADDSWSGRSVTPVAFGVRLVDDMAHRTWPHIDGRVKRSAAELVKLLIDPSVFAAGFHARRAAELNAALSMINDRFDDLPQQIEARLATMIVPDRWRRVLEKLKAELASRRDNRVALSARANLPHVIDPDCYDRVP